MATNFDISLNIQKRREMVLYKTSTLPSNINLAYTISKEINSKDNIRITDQSDALVANHIPEQINVREFTGKTYSSPVDKFKLTDIFTVASSSQEAIPLFYVHNIKTTLLATSSLHNIEVLDQNFLPIDLTQLVVVGGAIYNNLESESDITAGSYKTYFVRYSVTNSGITDTYIEILDNELVYKPATFSDIGEDGLLIPTHKVYLLDEYSSNVYQITLPTSKKYAIQEQSSSRIKLIAPAPSTTDNPWFVRVVNGNFLASLPVDDNWSMFKYNIPEFNSQTFQPYAPYKFANAEESIIVDRHLIKTVKNNIVVDKTQGMFVQVVLYREDGTVKSVFSNDPNKVGTSFNGLVNITTGIRSVGRNSGYIDLQETIDETDYVETFYFYEESEYEIVDIDFNPLDNPAIINQRVIFYLVPNTNNGRNKTVYYLLVDYNGKIKEYNQADTLPNLIDTDYSDFVNTYTVQSVNPVPSSNTKYLILGEVYLIQNSDDQSSALIDVRKNGGGLIQDSTILKELIELYPEVMWITGVTKWNGIPYPGNGSILIEVPSSIQVSNGGLFPDNTIRSITERHLACGVYPVIRTYGCTNIKPIEILPTPTSLKVNWALYGNEHSYDVYYSTNLNSGFIKANAQLIAEAETGYNTYTITNLTPATIYWIYIICGATGHSGSGSIVGNSPTNTTMKVYKTKVKTANAII